MCLHTDCGLYSLTETEVDQHTRENSKYELKYALKLYITVQYVYVSGEITATSILQISASYLFPLNVYLAMQLFAASLDLTFVALMCYCDPCSRKR